MTSKGRGLAGPLVASFRYVDARAGIDVLCDAFGFSRHAAHADDADPGLIHNAQLILCGVMVMLGSAQPGEAQARYDWKTPKQRRPSTSTSPIRTRAA